MTGPQRLAVVGIIMMIVGILLGVLCGCASEVPTLPPLTFTDDGGIDQK